MILNGAARRLAAREMAHSFENPAMRTLGRAGGLLLRGPGRRIISRNVGRAATRGGRAIGNELRRSIGLRLEEKITNRAAARALESGGARSAYSAATRDAIDAAARKAVEEAGIGAGKRGLAKAAFTGVFDNFGKTVVGRVMIGGAWRGAAFMGLPPLLARADAVAFGNVPFDQAHWETVPQAAVGGAIMGSVAGLFGQGPLTAAAGGSLGGGLSALGHDGLTALHNSITGHGDQNSKIDWWGDAVEGAGTGALFGGTLGGLHAVRTDLGGFNASQASTRIGQENYIVDGKLVTRVTTPEGQYGSVVSTHEGAAWQEANGQRGFVDPEGNPSLVPDTRAPGDFPVRELPPGAGGPGPAGGGPSGGGGGGGPRVLGRGPGVESPRGPTRALEPPPPDRTLPAEPRPSEPDAGPAPERPGSDSPQPTQHPDRAEPQPPGADPAAHRGDVEPARTQSSGVEQRGDPTSGTQRSTVETGGADRSGNEPIGPDRPVGDAE